MFGDTDSIESHCLSADFLNEFEHESEKKYLYIENNLVFVDNCVHESRNKSFERWIKSAQTNEDSQISYKFKQITTRLSKTKATTNRKNADLREFQIFKNFFLVKKFFTTGFKKVKPHERHIFTTLHKSLDVFVPKRELNLEEGTFESKTEYLYNKFTMPKFTILTFISGQEYIIIAPTKCLFKYVKEEVPIENDANFIQFF